MSHSKSRPFSHKLCFAFIFILCSTLLSMYLKSISYLLLPPTPLPSYDIVTSNLISEESIPTDSFTNNPDVVAFDLGVSSYTDSNGNIINFPIQGVLGVPSNRSSNFPVVFILPGYEQCLSQDPERHDIGFTYLAYELATNGYLAISLNIPPDYLLGYDSLEVNSRLYELFTAHLHYLNRALTGEDVGYSIDISGLGDLSSVSLISHSLNASSIYSLVDYYNYSNEIDINSLIFVAPSFLPNTPIPDIDLTTSIIIPQFDGEIVGLDGQLLYNTLKASVNTQSQTSLIYLYGANHNFFSSVFEEDDATKLPQSRVITNRLTSDEQRNFLASYAVDFLDSIYGFSTSNIGLDAKSIAPNKLYGYPVLTSLNVPDSLKVISPTGSYSQSFNYLGGDMKIKNASLSYVVDSYLPTKDTAGPFSLPGNSIEVPLLKLSWTVPSATITTVLPTKYKDVSTYQSLSLSLAVDPSNSLNPSNTPQSFLLELKDTKGHRQRILIDSSVATMHYQPGTLVTNAFTSYWSDFTPLGSLRIPTSLFNKVDLTNLYSISFIFNQSSTGSIMLGDLSFIK